MIVLFLVVQNSFASRPVPSIGIVVKKNNCLPKACKSTCNHGGGVAIITTRTGSFSSQLEEGEYELSFPQDQLKSAIERIIKTNYPKSNYEFDGSGVEFTLDNSQIRVKTLPTKGTIYSITEQNSDFVIIVPEGGATLSGVLNWDDTVVTNLETENRGIDKKDIKRMNSANQNPLYEEQNKEGVNPLFSGNDMQGENPVFDTKKKGLNAVNVKKGMNHWGEKKENVDAVANDAEVKSIAETLVNRKSVNNINGGMPNRISMNVTVPKQTQGATFGEKVSSGKINVTLIDGGCVVLFPLNEGYRINTSDKSITELSSNESKSFGEKVNAGLHAAGGSIAQGASLLGGSLPGGSIISAAVSSVGNLAGGAGGGAAAASYAKTGKLTKADAGRNVQKIQDDETNAVVELTDGEYELVFVVVEKATSGLKDTLKTQVRIGFTVESGAIKTKHDTAKNSVSNIR